MTPSGNVAPGWATSPASHTSGSAVCLVTAPSYPVAAFPKGSPYSTGEKDVSGVCPPLYEHVALCSGSTSPWCFRESGVGWSTSLVKGLPTRLLVGVVTAGQALWPSRGAVWLALRLLCARPRACPCRWKSSGTLMEPHLDHPRSRRGPA